MKDDAILEESESADTMRHNKPQKDLISLQ
jgi:hypothetical protein